MLLPVVAELVVVVADVMQVPVELLPQLVGKVVRGSCLGLLVPGLAKCMALLGGGKRMA